jgi:DNA-binding MarR family transcriptional regulator
MIQKEIFENQIMFKLGGVMKGFRKRANQLLEQEGLDIQIEQVPPLMIVSAHGAVSQQEIADMIGRDKSSIQRTITWLEKHGYVSISSDPNDKRRNIIKATRKGESIATILHSNMTELNDKMTNNIGKEEMKIFNNTIAKLVGMLNR